MLSELWIMAASPWVPTFVLVILALVSRGLRGSWFSPAPFVSLVWSIYSVACLLLTDYDIYPEGLWVIVLFVFSVQFGTVLSTGLRTVPSVAGGSKPDDASFEIWSGRSFFFCILFTVIALAGAVHLFVFSMEKYSLGFSFMEVLTLGHLWSVARYDRGEIEPWSVRLLIMWLYPAVLLAGICCASTHRKIHKRLSVLPLVPAFLIGTVFAARAGLLISGICWCSGFFAVRFHQNHGRYELLQRKLVFSFGALAICGLLFFIGIDTLRIFEGGGDIGLRIDVPRLAKYFFGAIPAFSAWVHYAHSPGISWGAYTFSGIFDLIGVKHREIGVYGEMQTLAGGEDTNIYTLFRGLMQDFTLAGTCLFGLIVGALAGIASRTRSADLSVRILTLAAYYALIIFSPIISLFVYNGLILAWVVAALALGWPAQARTFESRSLSPA